MMDAAELLFEAFSNSEEAGAEVITIDWDLEEDSVKVTVRDNGRGNCLPDCFEKGVSDKGPNRGRGLYLIKEADKGAWLRRIDGWSVLCYQMPLEAAGFIKEVLPFLFARSLSAFTYHKCKAVTRVERSKLEELYGRLDSVKALSGMKKLFLKFD